MNVVVLAGGISTERDVSLVSGKMIYNALKKNGHNVVLLDVYLGTNENDIQNIFSNYTIKKMIFKQISLFLLVFILTGCATALKDKIMKNEQDQIKEAYQTLGYCDVISICWLLCIPDGLVVKTTRKINNI